MNPINGEKAIEINGVTYALRYTWKALAEVEGKYGDNPNLFNTEVLANVASAGLKDKHPEMTADLIMELSPPLMPFCAAVRTALQWAYFGNETLPSTEPEQVKKNRLADMWSRLIKRLSRVG